MKLARAALAVAVLLAASTFAPAQTTWSGGAGADMNWSTANNWLGSVPPVNNAVLFTNSGAVATASNINNIVDAAFIAQGGITTLQYSQTNANHTTLIPSGQTLSISGGLSAGTETDEGANQSQLLATITGPGATINLSGGNLQAHQGSGTSGTHRFTLDLSGLDTLNATINRVLVGVANSSAGSQNRTSGALFLARTNFITAGGSVPALDVGDTGSAGNNGTLSSLLLGQTNVLFVNGVATARLKAQTASIRFNPLFTANNGNPAAFFRGSDGSSRVPSWALADGIGNSGGTVTPTATNDFSGGAIDALVETLTLGKTSTAGTPASRAAVGILTLSAGTFDVNSVTNGWQTQSGNDVGVGIINVNGTATFIVNNVMEMGRVNGTAVANTRGVLNINGGSARIANLSTSLGSTNNTISISGGSLILTNATLDSAAGPGIQSFSITNANLTLQVQTLNPALQLSSLAVGDPNNKINIASIPVLAAYPTVFTLVKYGAYSGATNIGLGTLPHNLTPYAGYISNDFANSAIDLVITGGPAPARAISWSGSPNGNWDIASTANWKDADGNATIFNQTDFVRFDDTASGSTTVNLTTQLDPTSLTVNNTNKNYTFSGTGLLEGSVGILKQGPGTLIIDNSGFNTFSGGIDIAAGTIQFGNNDANANIPPTGSLDNNGTLAFNQNSDLTVPNPITGSGNITQNGFGSGILRLAAANSFTGAVTVTSGTLAPANNSALGATNGSTTINPGATLDVQGAPGGAANALNLGLEPIIVSGSGIGGNGAIVNNGSVAQQNGLRSVTLAGNTTFGGNARWDIRGAGANLSTSGNGYSITKIGLNQVSLVSVNPVDAALGDINVQQGNFAVQLATAGLGDPTKTVTVSPGATFSVYNLSTPINKQFILNGDGTVTPGVLFAENGNSTILGSMLVNGTCTFNVGGVSLNLSNSLAGDGTIYKNGGGGLLLSGTVAVGGVITNAVGALAINGTVNTPVLSLNTANLFGYGTNNALVDVQGSLNPGSSNAPGAFAATAGLILESGASLTLDLGTNNTADPTINDVINVTGDLAATNIIVYINQYQGRLQAGSYRVINYSGNLLGDPGFYFNPPQSVGVSRYTFAIDTATPHQVNVVVSGSAADLKWAALAVNGSGSWDVTASQNWLNGSTPDLFYNGDSVTLDDSVPGVTNILNLGAGVVVQPSAITVNSTANNYTIAGPGKITGATGLTKSGPSTLTITSTNDFTGPINVLAGTLKVGSNPALGATNSGTTIASGAALDVGGGALAANALNLGLENVTVSGAGPTGQGVIVNSNTNAQQNALRCVTLAGDTTLGGVSAAYWIGNIGRWDIRSLAANTDIASPTTGFLSTSGNPYNLTKTGSNIVCLVGLAVDPALADINILQGAMSFEHSTTLGDPAKTLTVTNGATMQLWQTWPSNLLNKVLVLYGDGATTNIYNPSGNNIFVGPITLNSGVPAGNCVFTIQGATLTLSNNTISGATGLTKLGSGTLISYDDGAFGGPTLINAGTLALAGNGNLNFSRPGVTVAAGATLDVSARSDATYTTIGSQRFFGSGTVLGSLNIVGDTTVSPGVTGVANGIGTLTVTNSVTLSGTASMDLAPGTNDVIKAGTSITYGGVLALNFTPGSLTNGQAFKLFSAASYQGSFDFITPDPGTGYAWNTSLLNVSGILAVQSTVATYPTNITAIVSGGSLNLSWPADHLGWWLQVQTNAPAAGLSQNWVTIPGSSATTSTSFPIDLANGSVFCRLVYTNTP